MENVNYSKYQAPENDFQIHLLYKQRFCVAEIVKDDHEKNKTKQKHSENNDAKCVFRFRKNFFVETTELRHITIGPPRSLFSFIRCKVQYIPATKRKKNCFFLLHNIYVARPQIADCADGA